MKNKHKGKSIIPQHDPLKQIPGNFSNKDLILQSHKQGGNNATVLISLRFVHEEFECFSEWSKQDMKLFWNFNRSVHAYKWQHVIEQGGKAKKKVGFGYTKVAKNLYPEGGFISAFNPDVDFFEMRLGDKARVHGFRYDSIFYICWLDRNHNICS